MITDHSYDCISLQYRYHMTCSEKTFVAVVRQRKVYSMMQVEVVSWQPIFLFSFSFSDRIELKSKKPIRALLSPKQDRCLA